MPEPDKHGQADFSRQKHPVKCQWSVSLDAEYDGWRKHQYHCTGANVHGIIRVRRRVRQKGMSEKRVVLDGEMSYRKL